ncbi:MAG: tape measure protein [Rhodoferax sp.]|nr:tape measure protein [Rhodoferax sp.]
MSQKVGSIFYDVTLDTGGMIDGQRKVQRELDSTTGSLDGFGKKLTAVASAIGAYAAALYLIEKSDAFTKMNAQLKLATDSSRELAIAQADVKRIAQEAQADIGAVAMLYAKVTSSTKELGLAQKTVADITRTVSLALKVSGASAGESGSAIMQLGQAFASGVLRGDEFNSVNEAAPRLMKALADGIGVPVGQLRAMAEAGKLTSEVLANALPKALKDLEAEAKQIQTISGAFQELKNEVMLFIGEQTTASGAVQVVAGSISALTNNLGLLAGVLATVAAVKFAVWLESIVAQTYATVAANQAMRISNVAAAESQVVATAATASLTAARVAELRAAVMAAEGNVALAVTTNGLIPAQARAAVAAEAHAVALGTLTVAQRAASVSGTAAAGVMSLLGGPIGAITAVLGLGATAWMLWGKSADESSKQAENAIEASGREIIASLDKQNAKLRERLALAKAGNVDAAKSGSKDAERLASTLGEINTLKAKGNAITGSDRIQLAELEGRYRDISAALKTNKGLTEEIAAVGQQSKASEWMTKYANDAERVNAEIAKAKKELGAAFTPELEQRIRAKIIPPKKAAAEKKTADQKFDDAGYLAGLEAASVDAWVRVGVVEDEAKRKNDKLLAEKKISAETHERAITLITADAVKARQAISESEISAAAEAGLKRMEQRDKGRQVAQETIAGVNPIDALRLEEEQKIAVLEEFRLLDLANTQIYEDAKLAVKKTAAEKIKAVEDDLRTKEQAVQSAQLMAYSGMFGSIADLTKTFGDKQSGAYKAMFAVSKAFAIADSIIKIQQGIAGAAALPFPLNMPAIGAVIAATSGIISTIGGTNFAGGRQYGGPANSGNLYRVNEKGAPEMFTAGNGQQYMMPTQSGRVTAADQVGSSKAPTIIIQNMGTPQQTQSQTYDQQSNTVKMVMADLVSQISGNSGPVWSALRGASNVTGRM